MKRKILYISGTRADYGMMRSVLCSIHNHLDLSLDIVVTGMHLMDEFGNTIDEIIKDNFSYHIVDVQYEDDTKEAMAIFIGRVIQKFVPLIHYLRPDIILVLGDRGEMLAGAIVGVYMSIPVAHIHGGEVTTTVDDYARNAITKLAHIHFPATEESKERIIGMGEDASRIFIVGAPGLDQILNEPLLTKEELTQKYLIDFSKPVLLVVQHPVTLEVDSAPEQMRETLEAVVSLQYQTIVIYPNADAGGREMIKVIREYELYPTLKIFSNIPHKDYISLLSQVNVIIGNSSSAIIEAPSFGLPAVNIGTRQMGRKRADNIIDAIYDRKNIQECINKAIYNNKSRQKTKLCRNPYGDGNSSEKIVEILSKIDINENLLIKFNQKGKKIELIEMK
jgi:GDP/UDP-N,N'-diacetylbacillosamine 2-epimerase (hydrolysing)